VRPEVHDDVEASAVVGVVGERGAEARRPALAGVGATLLLEGRRAQVLVAAGEQIPDQHVAHLGGVGRWAGDRQTDRVAQMYKHTFTFTFTSVKIN